MLSAGSVAALLSQLPGGEVLDKVRSKRAVIAIGTGIVIVSALVLAFWPRLPSVFIGLVLQGVTGGFLGPAIAAISLGLVGHAALAERLGRNQRFASTGALAGAALMGLVGYLVSYQAIFLIVALLGLPLFFALARIRAVDIHFGRSCGAPGHHGIEQPPRAGRPILLKDSRLVIFATRLANASVLPLAGEILVRKSQTHSSLVISALIIVPQIIVALMAPWVGRRAQDWGRRPLLLIGFAALPVRALGFALISDPLLLLAVQALDGDQCNRTRGSHRPDHCRPDGRYRTFQLSAGHCWNSIRHWRLNQHNAIRTGRREAWPERGVFVYRRHRVARNTHDLVSDAGDKTTD